MSSKVLRVSPTLTIPPSAVTSSFAYLGIRGSGKSNGARVTAEEMHKAGLHFVAVDPIGSWWGVQSSRDGKRRGLDVPVFGGRHGNLPLEDGSGEFMADLVVAERLSCVLDVTSLSEAGKHRFLAAFGRRLYQKNERPVHVFLEEADDYAPQQTKGRGGEVAKTLGVFQDLVRRGRARGIGVSMLTQRSAVINKDLLTQCETLFAFRVVAPQDHDAIARWTKHHAAGAELVEKISSLQAGEAIVFSPHYLEVVGKHRFRLAETFDSGATPTGSGRGKKIATLADVDLKKLRDRMADAIERAKAEDPAELKREVARLRAALAKKLPPVAAPKPAPAPRPLFGLREIIRFEKLAARVKGQVGELSKLSADVDKALSSFVAAVEKDDEAKFREKAAAHARHHEAEVAKLRVVASTGKGNLARDLGFVDMASPVSTILSRSVDQANGDLPKGEAALLNVIASARGGALPTSLTIATGYTSESRRTYLQRLTSKGLIQKRDGRYFATPAGFEKRGPAEELPTGAALREHWFGKLPAGEAAILRKLVDARMPMPMDWIANATSYSAESVRTYVQRLAARELVVKEERGVSASPALF